MSYIQDTVQCQDCKKHFNVACGVVGMEVIASWPTACECGGKLKKISAGWSAEELNGERHPMNKAQRIQSSEE